MSIFSKLFGHKDNEEQKIGGMEDYMTLIRVYFQAAIAERVGITNLNALPDLRQFKTSLHIPTVNNKLGIGEKSHCKKCCVTYMAPKTISSKKSTKASERMFEDARRAGLPLQFQNFTQNLMMLTGNLMKFKLRLPSIFKKALYSMTEKTISDIFNKNNYTDQSVLKAVVEVRQYDKRLGFSQKWTTDFVYQVVMLAKKEKKPQNEE